MHLRRAHKIAIERTQRTEHVNSKKSQRMEHEEERKNIVSRVKRKIKMAYIFLRGRLRIYLLVQCIAHTNDRNVCECVSA